MKNGKMVVLATSSTVHATTTSDTYGSATSLKVNKKKITLKRGRKYKIKASEVNENRIIQQHRSIRFVSTAPSIAKVSSKGTVKALRKGSCRIWIFAQNGVHTSVIVTVK